MKQPGVSQERAGPRSWGRNEPGVAEELREACHSSSAGSEGPGGKEGQGRGSGLCGLAEELGGSGQ